MDYTSKKKLATFFVYFCLIFIVIISIFPVFWMILTSIKPTSETLSGLESLVVHNPTLGNYSAVNKIAPMLYPTMNSIFVTFFGTVSTLFFCSLAGFAFAKFRFPGRDALFLMVLVTLLIPQEVGIVPLFTIMRSLHLTNSLWSLIIPRAATALGIFYMRQYCMSVPDEIVEAARIDGCRDFTIYTRVILPIIKPALASWASLTMISRWNDFFWPLIFMRTPKKYTLMVTISLLPVSDGLSTPWPVIMAGTSIAVLPIIILYFLFQKFQKADLMAGAVKG